MSNITDIIDHTLLRADASQKDIDLICKEALEYEFASVCINPSNVKYVADILGNSKVKVCTVVGFPLGANTIETKVQETKEAIENGATEIDMVINIGQAKVANYDYIQEEVISVVNAAKEIKKEIFVKVILETCYLTDFEKIKICSIAKEVGADAVKTSTGFGDAGATVEDVALMRQTVGPIMCVKASGGIRTLEDFNKMVEAGATRIGTSAGVSIVKEYLKLKGTDEIKKEKNKNVEEIKETKEVKETKRDIEDKEIKETRKDKEIKEIKEDKEDKEIKEDKVIKDEKKERKIKRERSNARNLEG